MAGLALGLLFAMHESLDMAGLGNPGPRLWRRGISAGLLLWLLAMVLGNFVALAYKELAQAFHLQAELARLTTVDRRTDISKVISATHAPAQFWAVVLIGTFLAPVAEELLFRGLIYRVVARYRNETWAVAVSSLVFAVAHGGPIRFVTLLVLGTVLGITRRKTGSVWQGMIMHMTLNGIMFLAMYTAQNLLK